MLLVAQTTEIRNLAGAGAGGIATAARLAKAGFRVTVLEKNDFTGGRCSLIHHEGYVSYHTNTFYNSKSTRLSYQSLP